MYGIPAKRNVEISNQGVNVEMEKKRKSGRLRHIHAYFVIFSNIQIYSGKVRRNQTYPGIIQASPGIFRAPLYSEPWHIPTQRHIQKSSTSRNLTYAEL